MKRYAIIYFSHSGNTQKIAYAIHRKIPSDLFRILVKEPYATVYTWKLENIGIPNENKESNDFEDYDTIILCTPVWWYGIASPVTLFLSDHKINHASLIVFCIHGGYGIGHSKQDIKALCPQIKTAFFEIPFHLRKMAISFDQFTQIIKTIQKEDVRYDENTHISNAVSTSITRFHKV